MWELTNKDKRQFCYELDDETCLFVEFTGKQEDHDDTIIDGPVVETNQKLLQILKETDLDDLEDALDKMGFQYKIEEIYLGDYSDEEIKEYIDDSYNQTIAKTIYESYEDGESLFLKEICQSIFELNNN